MEESNFDMVFGIIALIIIFIYFSIKMADEKAEQEKREIEELNKSIEREKSKLDYEYKLLIFTNKKVLKLNDEINELNKNLKIDETGRLVLVEYDSFMKIVNKYQDEIIKVDKNIIKLFIKINNFIEEKRTNILKTYDSERKIKPPYFGPKKDFESIKGNIRELQIHNSQLHDSTDKSLKKIKILEVLINQIKTYELLIIHSLSMVSALIDKNFIIFYEIYEKMDKLTIFDSNWENKISYNLSSVDQKLSDLIETIEVFELNMLYSLGKINYSIKEMEASIIEKLEDVNSTMQINNFLTAVQVYQLYKINNKLK